MEKDIEKLDLSKPYLVTEFHKMSLYKAAFLGIPCLIDEVNIIDTEVLASLNDVFTKKP
jgi:hypothetical protein